MAINLITAGTKVYYAVEETAGTRPNNMASYTQIIGLKSIPEMNPEPEALETTELEEEVQKTYVAGLKDPGGALPFLINLRDDTADAWDNLVKAYETGIKTGLETWFYVQPKGLSRGWFFTGEPSEMGIPSMEVNAVLEANVYITPTSAPQKLDPPTT